MHQLKLGQALDIIKSVITYRSILLIHVLPVNVPRHPEVCHFTRQIFAQEYISSCQVTMNNL